MASATRLSADDWIAAGYARFHDGGLGGVRVEAIARDLGTTKGSFYHHFADRAALVAAVMDRWSREETDRFTVEADAAADPRERLAVLFRAISQRRMPGEASLYLDAEREGVTDWVRTVTARRVDYVASALVELGIETDEARRRAFAAVGTALGLELLARGGAGPLMVDRGDMVGSLLRALTA
ncbi:TetR/AcrR family transcriptional regulator [Pseudolysinimonas yzui]|nr:TetR/AcrR family transcriptional regulator [Pseudolysinimonas yzui]